MKIPSIIALIALTSLLPSEWGWWSAAWGIVLLTILLD